MARCKFWKEARPLLIQDIAGGFILENMMAEDVHKLRDEYAKCKLANFKTNLKNLREALNREERNANEDATNILHDRSKHPIVGNPKFSYPRWDGSAASRLLKHDVDNGIINQKTPKELQLFRPEYQLFPLEVFRKHIHQEKQKRLGRAYWMHKHVLEQQKKNK